MGRAGPSVPDNPVTTSVLSATRTWTDSLAARPQRPRPDADGQRRTVEQLLRLLDDARGDLLTEARRRPLAEVVVRQLRDGRTVELSRAAVVTQVTTHGMHHRAQCLNMLRQLGVTPLPASSVADWTWLGEGRG